MQTFMLDKRLKHAQKQSIPDFFAGLKLSPADLKLDRAVKILGWLPQGEQILYCVQFRPRLDESVPLPSYFSHEELTQHKPALLMEYLLKNSVSD